MLLFLGDASAGLFEGAAFPAPSSFSNGATFREAAEKFDRAINESLANGITGPPLYAGLPLNKTSFSIAMFSTSQSELLVLGLVIERIYGAPFAKLLERGILGPLGMNNTFATVPRSTAGSIIPLNASASGWENDLGVAVPAAGIYSSTNDLARMGSAILRSSLLSPTATRRWLKAQTFTASSMFAVGAPCEIRRVQSSSQIVDQYTKEGNWGAYASYLVLLPDYNTGFALLAASLPRPQSQAAMWAFRAMVQRIWIPALEEIGREQANAAFVGSYSSASTNSSMTIVTDQEAGLKEAHWVSDGVNVLQTMRTDLASFSPDPDLDFRLYPNLLYPANGKQIGFASSTRWLTGPFPAWESIDGLTYGSIGIDNFIFEMDDLKQKAMSVESMAYRHKLVRVK